MLNLTYLERLLQLVFGKKKLLFIISTNYFILFQYDFAIHQTNFLIISY